MGVGLSLGFAAGCLLARKPATAAGLLVAGLAGCIAGRNLKRRARLAVEDESVELERVKNESPPADHIDSLAIGSCQTPADGRWLRDSEIETAAAAHQNSGIAELPVIPDGTAADSMNAASPSCDLSSLSFPDLAEMPGPSAASLGGGHVGGQSADPMVGGADGEACHGARTESAAESAVRAPFPPSIEAPVGAGRPRPVAAAVPPAKAIIRVLSRSDGSAVAVVRKPAAAMPELETAGRAAVRQPIDPVRSLEPAEPPHQPAPLPRPAPAGRRPWFAWWK